MRSLALYVFTLVVTTLAVLTDRRAGTESGDDKARGTKEAPRSFEDMRRDARDPKPGTRRKAVRELAHVGSREAWLAVIDALDDPESEVGDAAELAISALHDEKLVRELCGKLGLCSKSERVRVRVAEALGRAAGPIDGELLARQLASNGGEVTRRLLWSIERLAAGGRLGGELSRVITAVANIESSRKDIEISCAALIALVELDATNLRTQVLSALNDRVAARRIAGLRAAQQAELPERLDWARKACGDDDPSVRVQAFECLEALRTKAALLALVAQLEREPRLRLRWRIVESLQRTSGLKNRLDPRPWKLWAEQLPSSGTIAHAARPATTHDDQGATVTGLAGMELISDRVCFLFDFSGSMWTPLDDGRLPKDVVAIKLREALATLDEATAFNLIPFTYDPLPWQPHLQPAKKANISKALEFFDTCTARGRGNFYDAALLALADPQVDTIVALTDGVPTGGLHSDMDLIVPLLLERTRFRKVAFDSILVDARLGTARRWNELSVKTGGSCVEVELGKE